MSDADAYQMAGMFGGALSILTLVGSGIKWVFGRSDRKEAALEAREEGYVAKLEARIIALEKRDEKREAELVEMRAELHDTRAALIIVAQEVAVSNPGSPALLLARKLLKERFPLDLETPADMLDTLKKI
jgi:hypothetical protein